MFRRGQVSTEVLQFDVVAYLQSRNIPVSFQSEHTSSGYVNIQCPFCHDPSDHLGINLTTKAVNCWICGGKNITRLVAMLEGGCSYAEANTIMRDFKNPILGLMYEEETPSTVRAGRRNILPKLAIGPEKLQDWPPAHLHYLENRRFDPELVIPKYHLHAVAQAPQFGWRIIIPVIQSGRIVTFAAMDITRNKAAKYLSCPNQTSIVPIKDTLYNIDSVTDTMLIVEGYSDVWRVGDGTVAVMGLQFTNKQLQLIVNKSPRQAVILFDGESRDRADFVEKHRQTLAQAKKLALNLKGLVPSVDVLEMSHNDPGDLLEREVVELRNLIFGA